MADAAQLRSRIEALVVNSICVLKPDGVKAAIGLLFDYIDAQAVPVPPPVIGESEAFDLFRSFVRDNAKALRMVAHWGDGHCGALHRVLVEQLQGNGSATVVQPLSNGGAADGGRALAPLFPEDGGVAP